MKKLTLLLATAVLMTSVSFAQNADKKQDPTAPKKEMKAEKKEEKKAEKKEKKEKKAEKKDEKKTK